MYTEWIIARQFWQMTFAGKAIRALLLVIGLLTVYAAVTGWVRREKQDAIRHDYQEQARKDWLENPDKHPHRMAHYGHFAFRPKPALSVFDPGMESFLGNAVFLEAHRQNSVNFSDAGLSTGTLRFGEISLAMILQLLVPLLIIFLGFGTIATDRENGTLRLLLSQGVSWRQLLAGKSFGLLAVSLTVFGPVMLLAAGLWLTGRQEGYWPDEVIRLLCLGVFYTGYLAFFCVITVLVSAASPTAKTALVALTGLWLTLTIVLPRASQALGSALYPAPSKVQFEAAIHADIVRQGDSHNPDDPHYKALKDSLLAANHADSVQQLAFNYSGFVMAEGEKISAAIYNRHFDGLQQTFAKQNRFAGIMAFADPYMAVKKLSMAMAGTDYGTYLDFQRQAEAYRYDMAQTLNDLQIRLVSNKKLASTDKPYVVDRKYWAQIPDFHYQSPSVGAVLVHETVALAAFAGWVLLLVVLLLRLSKTFNAV